MTVRAIACHGGRPAYPFLLANPPCNADLAATDPLSNGATQPGPQATASASTPVPAEGQIGSGGAGAMVAGVPGALGPGAGAL